MCLEILVAIGTCTYLCKKRNERLMKTSPATSEPRGELGGEQVSNPQVRAVNEDKGESGGIDVILHLSLEKGQGNPRDIKEGTNVDIQMRIALSDDESHYHVWSDVDVDPALA